MARHLIPSAYVTFDKANGTVSFNGNHHKENILLITDVTAAKTLYQFNSRNFMGSVAFSEATEQTTVTLDYDTANDADITVGDVIQVFVDVENEAVTVAEDLLDGVGKIRVSNPGNLIDTDFEYGLQSTKWETLQSVNNIPTVYSSSGDKPIDGIVSVDAVAGSKQVKVTTSVAHGMELGNPVSVQGLDDYQAEGFFTISGVDGDYTFFFELDVPATTTGDISGGYTTIVPAKFFEGSPLPISVIDGAQTDGGSPSKIDVTTEETHGFALGTKVYLRNTIGPKSLIIADPQATAPDGRPYIDTDSVFTTSIDVVASEDTGRANVRQNKLVTWDHQSTHSHYIDPTYVNVANNTLEWVGHGLGDRFCLLFNTPVLGDSDMGLNDGTVYFVEVIDENLIKLHSNYTLGSEVTLSQPLNAKGTCRVGLVYKIREEYNRMDKLYTEYNKVSQANSTNYGTADESYAGPTTATTANRYKATSARMRNQMNGEDQFGFYVANLFGGHSGYLDGLIANGTRIFLDRVGEGGGDLEAADEFSTVTFYRPEGNGSFVIGTGPNNPESFYIDSESATEMNDGFDVTAAYLSTSTTYGNGVGTLRYDLNESSTLIGASSWVTWYFRLDLDPTSQALFKANFYADSGADLALDPSGFGLGGVNPDRVLAFVGKTPTGGAIDADAARDLYATRSDNANSRYGTVKPVRTNVLSSTGQHLISSRNVLSDGSFRINFNMGDDSDRLIYLSAGEGSHVYYMFSQNLNADRNTIYEVGHGIESGQTATVIVDPTDYAAGQRFKFASSAGAVTEISASEFDVTVATVSPDLFRITLDISPNTDDIVDFPDNFTITFNKENELYNTIYVNNHKIVAQSQATYLASGNNEDATVVYTGALETEGEITLNGKNLGENAPNAQVRVYRNQAYQFDISGLTSVATGDRPSLWVKDAGTWSEVASGATVLTDITPVYDDATDPDIRTITFTVSNDDTVFGQLQSDNDYDLAISVGNPDSDSNFVSFDYYIVSDILTGVVNGTAYNLNRVNDSRLTLTQTVDTSASATTAVTGAANNNTITNRFIDFETPLGITPTGASITGVQYRGDFNETREYVKITFADATEYFIGRTGGADTQSFRNDSTWVTKDVTPLLVDNGGVLGINVTFDPTSRIDRRIGSMSNWWEIRFIITGATGTIVLNATGVDGEQEFLVDSLRGAYDGVFAIIDSIPAPDEFILETDFKIPAREYSFTGTDVDQITGTITFPSEHNLITGEIVSYNPGTGNTSMLTDETDNVFNVIVVSSTEIKLAVSSDSALNNIETGVTAQTGTHTLKARSLVKAISGQGLITFNSGESSIQGSGTKFLTTFKRFDRIFVKGADYVYSMTVRDIQTNEKMRVFETFEETVSSASEYFFTTQLMLRPDGYSLHKSFDGGVDITAGTSPDSKIVRQSRKYFRYQSGKGIQNSLAINFNPPRIMRELIKADSATARVITQEQHNLRVGDVVTVSGAEVSAGANNPYNGRFEVSALIDEFTFEYEMGSVPDEAKASGFPAYTRAGWTDSYVRAGMFDDQNGFFFEFDGQKIYTVVRSSTTQLAGSVTATRNSQVVTGNNTSFTTQVNAGDKVVIRGQSYKVVEVSSDLRMVVQPAYRGVTSSGIKATKTEDRKVEQANWNIDKCDGHGPTGYKLDTTKIQMCYADYSWYGAGKVRFGFKDRNGHIRYVHQFIHNNRLGESYFRSGNLPGRYEIENGPNATTAPTLFHFGTSIIMDGRFDDDKAYLFSRNSKPFAFTNGASRTFSTNAISSFDVITLNGKRVFVYALPCSLADATATVVGSQISQGSTFPEGTYVTQVKLDGATSKVYTSYPASNNEPSLSDIASATTITNGEVSAIALDQPIPLVSLRLAPSVDSSLTGAIGEREIVNRMQLRLRSAGITSNDDLEVFLILNAIPSNAEFQGAESPSLSQIIDHNHGDTLEGGTTIYSVKASAGSIEIDLTELLELGNSILGGDGVFPNGPDLLTVAVQPQSTAGISGTAPFFVTGKISWSESQA